MALKFDPATGLEAPDTSEIRSEVAQDWIGAFYEPNEPELDVDSTTPAGQLIDAETAEIEAKNADILFLSNQFNPKSAEGRWQDAQGALYFITRKANEPTVVTCQLTGLNGTVIPYGALARNDDGETLQCNSAVTIGTGGTATTTFRCTVTGPIDIPAGSVNTIVTTIAGWDTIANADPGVVGRNIETRADFEARRYESVAKNAHGSAIAVYGALNDIAGTEGVLDVKILENIGPDPVIMYGVVVNGHGICVAIYGGLNSDIARVIYEKKGAGADVGSGNTLVTHIATEYSNAVYTYNILRPTLINFWIKIRLAATTTLTAQIQQNIKQAVFNDFLGENVHTQNPRVGLATDIFASRFLHAASAVEGVTTLLGAEVALVQTPTDSDYVEALTINADQEPVMTIDQVIIEIVGA